MRLIALKVENLINDKHFAFMQFVLAALGQFQLLEALFGLQTAAFKAAFDHENHVYLKSRRNFLTPEVQGAEEARDRKFRIVHDALKVAAMLDDQAKAEAAKFLLAIIKDYGGLGIINKPVDAESGALSNLAEDLLEKYADKVALLGLTAFVEEMQAANNEYIRLSAERTFDESQRDKAAMAKARRETDIAYRGLINSINLHVQYHGDGELLPFIKYLNAEIQRYRTQLGQGVGNPDWGGDEEIPEPGEEPDEPEPSEPSTPEESEPTTPTDPTKILLLFNDGAHGNVIVKRMEVAPGYQLTASDLPDGFVYAFKSDDQADIDAASPGDTVWVTLAPRG